jgi:ribonuclease VapC
VTATSSRALVIDTSAAVAVILREPGSDALVAHLERAVMRLMSAATRVELGIVIEARLGPDGLDVVARFLRDTEVETTAVDDDGLERALSAWRRYGKGRHRAGLNFGDCFSFALAERTGLPLLCTREDFPATGIDVLGPSIG